MKLILFITLVSLISFPTASRAWDLVYDGSVLPNDPSLGTSRWVVGGIGNGLSMCSTDGDLLYIDDALPDVYVYFMRDAPPPLTPFTMESRVRVADESEQPASMGIGAFSFSVGVAIYPSYLQVCSGYEIPVTYWADMSIFRTLRVAVNAGGEFYVWLDQALVAQGTSNASGQGIITFGSKAREGLSRSYWDYVAYSASFVPVPEPSTLFSLSFALLAASVGVRWRRRE